MNNKLMLIIATIFLNGCSSLGVGENNFKCELGANDGYCASATEVYKLTNPPLVFNKDNISSNNIESNTNVSNINNNKNKTNAEYVVGSKIEQIQDMYSYSDQGVPIRTPTRVMRIWIAPWIDSSDSLNMSGLVYTDIETRKWTIGEKTKTTKASGFKFKKVSKDKPIKRQSEKTDNLQPTTNLAVK